MARSHALSDSAPRVLGAAAEEFQSVVLKEHPRPLWGVTATHAKQAFGELFTRIGSRPVVITRNDRPMAVVLTPEHYLALMRIHDEYMAAATCEAEGAPLLDENVVAGMMDGDDD